MMLVYIALIAFFSGLVKGSSGFGSSLVALPLLVYFYPYDEIVIMMITINVFLNTLLLFENKVISFHYLKDIWVIILFGTIFTFVGIYLMSNLDEKFIKYFAAFLIFFAVSNRIFDFKLTLSDNFFTQALTGSLSGIGNGTASIDGPPLVFFLTGIKADKAKFKNTLASYFLVIGIISILLLMVDGNYTVDILINSSYVAVFAIVGVLSGILIGKHINESNFNKIVIVLLISLGISLFI